MAGLDGISVAARLSGGYPTYAALRHPPLYFPIYGRISPLFTRHCFRFHYYCGPRWYPHECWYPLWHPWVEWSWRFRCHPLWDPRPLWCRPVFYEPCSTWIWYGRPAWAPLPVVLCGTWVEVERVSVPAPLFDLQLLAVRLVDPGHPEERLGPRYRAWLRNNSDQAMLIPFDVGLVASIGPDLKPGLPQAGVRVTWVEAKGVQSVDVRLPVSAVEMGTDAKGQPIPFDTLHVLVDAGRVIAETDESNNGVALPVGEILPVDPAAFEVDPKTVAPGKEVVIAGEGLGPGPGRVLLHLGGIEMEPEILGWYDLGVRLSMPDLPLAGPVEAELIVVRGDGAAANPLPLTINPAPDLAPPKSGAP